jgi:D-sedoheptulose 7-phosphate isomerase
VNGPEPAWSGHLVAHVQSLLDLDRHAQRLDRWGERLAGILLDGGRLLAAGNGGSAAQAQHLAAELVGRYQDERAPLSALALTSDGCAVSAIANDYGWAEGLARQVLAHGRRGDVLIALSTSGESANVLAAARAARSAGMRTWALTGASPNSLQRLCDEALAVPGRTPIVQEVHLVAIHLLCAAVDAAVAAQAEPHCQSALSETG